MQVVPWLLLLTVTGFTWSLTAVVHAFVGLAIPGEVAQSVLGSFLALLGGLLGTFGTVLFVRRGWDTRLRTLEWLFFTGILVARVLLGSGPGAETSLAVSGNLFWAAAPVIPGMVAWSLGERLIRPLVQLIRDGSATDAYSVTRRYLSALLLTLCGAWAAASFALPSVAPAEHPLAVVGGLLCVPAAFVLLTIFHQVSVNERLAAQGVNLDSTLRSGVPRVNVGFVVGAALIGILLPANLSPFQLRDFNQWMVILTERFLGPLLVPSQGPARGIGDGLSGLSLQNALEGLERGGSARPAEDLLTLLLQIALFVGVAYFAWRVFRVARHSPQGTPGYGSLLWGLGWLYQQVRGWVVDWLTRIGLLGWKASERLRTSPGTPSVSNERSRRSRPALNTIAALYGYVLERMADRGLARRVSETPYEFLGRWRREAPAADESGLPALTRLYVAVRYQERLPGTNSLLEARHAASRALRGWTRAALRSKLFGWIKGK